MAYDEKKEYSLQKAALFFSVLGDTGRIKIIEGLLHGEMCVNHIAQKAGMSQSAVSHQLRILKQSDLVKFRRDGKNILYSLDDEHVKAVFLTGLEHVEHKLHEWNGENT